jgi:protein-L-isoaspartate O-methyltransferase
MTSSMGDGARGHYDRLAPSYDDNWAHSPDYIAWMTGRILDRAAIRPGQVVADIGCGMGLYSRGLAAAASRVICDTTKADFLHDGSAGNRLSSVAAAGHSAVTRTGDALGSERPHHRMMGIELVSPHHKEAGPA